MFSVSADPRDGFAHDSSLIMSPLSVAGFSVLITESCDEDVEESCEMKKRNSSTDQEQRMGRGSLCFALDSFAFSGEMWFF